MLMKAGYKQTEFGIIPENWEIVLLETLLAQPIQNGIFNDPRLKGYGYKLINVINLYGQTPIDTAGLEYLSASKTEVDRFKVNHGDVFFTRSSITPDGIAQCNIYDKKLEEVILFDCHIIRVVINQKKINPFYFYRYCSGNTARKYMVANAKTTTMTTIDQSVIAKLPVLLPSTLAEQTAIATALSDTDELIQSLEKLIAKKQLIKQGAMQELLKPKAGWVEKTFGEVLEGFTSGQTPYRGNPEYYQGDIPWITSGELNYDIILDTNEKITKEAMKNTNLKIVPKGTFLMAITGLEAEGTRGSCGITGIDATTNQSCMALYPKNEIITEYLFHYYVCYGKRLALEYCQGTKQQSYTGATAKLLPIYLPPTTAEQQRIADILSDMDVELAALEAKLDKYRQLKQGMMQELLTGRIRLV